MIISISITLFLLLILFFNGLVIFSFLTHTSNKLLKIGAGMILGQLGFLLILSISSYILKDYVAILLIFLAYFLLCMFLKIRFKKDIGHFFPFEFSSQKIFKLILIVYILLFIRILPSVSPQIGSDAHIYDGIATSFARGNYPTVLPWQPNFLTVYHQGAFILEGALSRLGSINIDLMHRILAVYLLSAIFFIVTGIAYEYFRSVLSMLPAIFGIFLFSGPIILTSGFNNFFTEFQNILDFPNFIYSLSSYPNSSSFQKSLGGGASSLVDLYYFIFYTFGLATFILFLYLIRQKFQRLLLKYVFLVIYIVLMLSIDETFFLISLPIFLGYFIYDHFKLRLSISLKNGLIIASIFAALFFTIQNPIRDSLLTPALENPRFTLVYSLENIFSRISQLQTKAIEYNGTSWTMLGINLAIFLLLISIAVKLYWSSLFFISALVAVFFGSIITNTYFPGNNFRFMNQGLLLEMFGVGFLLIEIFSKFNKDRKLDVGLIIILLTLLPQLIINHAKIIKMAVYDRTRFDFPVDDIARSLMNIRGFIDSYNAKIIFVGSYIANIVATTRYGYFVPMGPTSFKILTPDDIGTEFYDVLTNLSPYAVRKLDLDYIFIPHDSIKALSEERIKQVNSSEYFQLIYDDKFGKLYKVKEEYKNLEDKEVNVKKLTQMVKAGTNVYLDNLDNYSLPKIIILELAKKVNLIGHSHVYGGSNYLYIETSLPYSPVCIDANDKSCAAPFIYNTVSTVDYIFANPKIDPKSIFKDGEYIKIGEISNLILWRDTNLITF